MPGIMYPLLPAEAGMPAMPPLPAAGSGPLPAAIMPLLPMGAIIIMPWAAGIIMKLAGGMAAGMAGGAATLLPAALMELVSVDPWRGKFGDALNGGCANQPARQHLQGCATLPLLGQLGRPCHRLSHPGPPAPTVGCTAPSPVCALLLTILGLTVVVGPLMLVVGPEMLHGRGQMAGRLRCPR